MEAVVLTPSSKAPLRPETLPPATDTFTLWTPPATCRAAKTMRAPALARLTTPTSATITTRTEAADTTLNLMACVEAVAPAMANTHTAMAA